MPEKLEKSGDSEKLTRSPSTEDCGCHHGSHLPLDMWHMYVTSPPIMLHQRCPVGLPSSGSGGQSEWYTPGAEDSKLNSQISQENHPETTGFTWNKLDSTGWNSTSPKCAPDTYLPLGKPVNHDYQIEHQRAPLSHC